MGKKIRPNILPARCRHRMSTIHSLAVTVKGGQDSLDGAADDAQQVLHGNGNNLLGLGDTEDDGGQDTETVETLDLVANHGVSVDEVGATLLGKGDTVALARAKAKPAESVLSGGDGAELYSRSEVGLNDIEAVDLCVE